MSDPDVLATLRARNRSRASNAPSSPQPTPEPPAATSFDFGTLPASREVTLQKRVARELGIASPYYRLNEAGATLEARYQGARQITFSSYDYLGLNQHPDVREASIRAIEEWGISPSASRIAGGERPYHLVLERALADLYGTEDCVTMVSGHATNVTVIGTLLGERDLIVYDGLSHNSVVQGARQCGAARLSMPHNDYDWLDAKLSECRSQYRHVMIAVEGLYSMDGDTPDLARLVEIKRRHDAWLMVDEAHSLGVLGARGAGLFELAGVDPAAVEIWMGTLSKTLATCGGYICGSAALVEMLKANAPGFVYSVGLPAPVVAGATAALAVMRREPERVARLRRNGLHLLAKMREAEMVTGLSEGFAVVPVMTGESLKAVRLSNALLEAGIATVPVIYPAVPERQARLRFFVTSEHRTEDIDAAACATRDVMKNL